MSIISGTKLAAPIGLQEVYSLLGVNKTGTYYDIGYICGNAHGRINPWSKYKPTRYNSPDGGMRFQRNVTLRPDEYRAGIPAEPGMEIQCTPTGNRLVPPG